MDIGGANSKAAFAKSKSRFVGEIRIATRYFPVWRNPDDLSKILEDISASVSGVDSYENVGITMTAELSDAYKTKREGVKQILTNVASTFHNKNVYVLDVMGRLLHLKEARENPLKVAAANWQATGWLVSQVVKDCIVMDVGSTSTSIIPIINGIVSAAGQTDLEKLIKGELVYTGSLRTNVATIVSLIPTSKGLTRVSSELFATSGDIHLILGNIKEEQFSVDTADGRERTRDDSLARLSRVVCADTEMLSEEELVQIAKYIYQKQVEQITDGLMQVCKNIINSKAKLQVVVTGLGRNFLAKEAALKAGLETVIDLDDLLPGNTAQVSSAVGLALMLANRIGGKMIQWKQ